MPIWFWGAKTCFTYRGRNINFITWSSLDLESLSFIPGKILGTTGSFYNFEQICFAILNKYSMQLRKIQCTQIHLSIAHLKTLACNLWFGFHLHVCTLHVSNKQVFPLNKYQSKGWHLSFKKKDANYSCVGSSVMLSIEFKRSTLFLRLGSSLPTANATLI